MKCRVKYLATFYLLTVLIFVAAKLAFMLAYSRTVPFTVGDVFDVVAHGLTLDLSTALYFLVVPFLLTVASLIADIITRKKPPLRGEVWRGLRGWRGLLSRAYNAVVAVAFALAFVADTSLYAFWQFKLDASCLSYLTSPTEAMASVTPAYLLLRLLAVVVVAAAIYCLYNKSLPYGGRLEGAFTPELGALLDAEAVLLVDDDEAEAGKLHGVLDDGVGADENLDGAVGHAFEHLAASTALDDARQQFYLYGHVAEKLPDGLQVLLGQDFGGGHDAGLVAIVDGNEHRHQRHQRLAGADVALQQAVHLAAAAHVVAYLADDALLGLGQREGQVVVVERVEHVAHAAEDVAPELAPLVARVP